MHEDKTTKLIKTQSDKNTVGESTKLYTRNAFYVFS